MKLYKYNEQELRDAVANSFSIAEALTKLNVSPYGGNYAVFRRAVKHFDIDTSHFTGQGWRRAKRFPPSRPIDDYLQNKASIRSTKLKKRLIKEGLLKHVCNKCELTLWLEQPIPLELHHIDGDSSNNALSNIELLCPNCHSFTDNYRNKKRGGPDGT